MAQLSFHCSAINAGKSTILRQSAHHHEEHGIRVSRARGSTSAIIPRR